jgi:hypothetical protein
MPCSVARKIAALLGLGLFVLRSGVKPQASTSKRRAAAGEEAPCFSVTAS